MPSRFCNKLEVFRQSFAHLHRREERGDLRFQLGTVKQQGQVADDVVHKLRHQRLHLLHADLPEKTALLQPGLDQFGPRHQIIPRTSPDLAIDDQPVLEGKMTDDPMGILQDGIVTGQRCQDIGFYSDIVGYVQKDAPQDRSDGNHHRPAERIAL